ncbi:carbohydrate kinase family protein [Reichenbachiella agarivorans]|uniref:Carbohydrate kinase family protein n=1 Tax=Reichenbachiella agarivorans TaxID=2979464 RepID=A0ABY6CP45_9BACT|nr:carbohydrate kinase family protein [Reichenbachiella agarivorans]UXP32247.1 carbohydrate kinase family protein [Reichenbachiella agarivorans]
MKKVLVVGELNVDIILNNIDGFPEIGKEILAEQMTVTLGSSSAIFASNLCSLGADVTFLGKIGQDQFGELIEDTLQKKGVKTDSLIKSKAYATGSTIVLNYDLDRANITFPGAMEHLNAQEVEDGIFAEVEHLHVSSIFMQPALKSGILDLFKRAKSCGLTTSLDPQWDPSEQWDLNLQEVLPYIDIFLPNRAELLNLTKTSTIEDGIDSITDVANIIAVKDGAEGSYLINKGKTEWLPAFLNKNVADAIGAGDSFDAGFIFQYIQDKPLIECLKFANLTGAINTTESGGTKAFENKDRIMEIAQTRFSYSI